MRVSVTLTVVALVISSIIAPLLISSVQAASCPPSNCSFEAGTNIPQSEALVWVRVDGSYFTLNRTFSFAYNSTHTIEVMNTTLFVPSTGARYNFTQWAHNGINWASTPTLAGNPFPILANYTSSQNGPFVAEFEKQFQVTLSFTDASGQPVSPPSSVTLTGPSTIPPLSSYTNQWLSANLWIVTDVTWQSMPGTNLGNPTVDLRGGSASVQIPIKAYSADVKVVDRGNNPVSGATVTITFANATETTLTTDNEGMVRTGLIPLGTYNYHVVYQGQDVSGAADASTTPETTVTLSIGGGVSTPLVSSLVILTIFGVALFMILLAIKVRRPPLPPTI